MYISQNLNYYYFYYFYYYYYYILYTGLEVFLIDVVNTFLYSFNSVVHTHYLEIFIKQIDYYDYDHDYDYDYYHYYYYYYYYMAFESDSP